MHLCPESHALGGFRYFRYPDFDFDFEDMTFAPVDPNMVDRDALDPGTEEDWADEYGL